MSVEGTNGAHVARATPQRPGRNAPEPEVRSRFEDALNRRDERQPAREGANGQAGTAGADAGARPQQRFDLMQDDGRRAPKPPRIEAAAVDAPGVQAAAPASPAATPVPAAAADAAAALPPGHAEFAARLDLPDPVGGGTFHLAMPDTRWIASQAVVATDGSGGLTLDVETRDGGGDAESRQMLRARLEARGHRITSLTFDPDRQRG